MIPNFSKTGQLIVFFVLAFAIGWLAFVPAMLSHVSQTPGAFIYLFSPALAGLITAFLAEGPAGVKKVLGRFLIWRFSLDWYLLAILLLPAIFLVAGLITLAQGSSTIWTGNPWYFVLASFFFLMVINSGEEIGWRGFALPGLHEVVKNRLVAGLILGLLWGLWHLPVYLDPQQSSFPLPLFLLFIIGLALVYSIVFDHTAGSLLAAILLHAGTDIAPRFIQIANFNTTSWAIVVILVWVSAIILYFVTRSAIPHS